MTSFELPRWASCFVLLCVTDLFVQMNDLQLWKLNRCSVRLSVVVLPATLSLSLYCLRGLMLYWSNVAVLIVGEPNRSLAML